MINIEKKFSCCGYNARVTNARQLENNISSIKVLEKCGFLHEAKLKKSIIKNNQLQDCYIYALLKS